MSELYLTTRGIIYTATISETYNNIKNNEIGLTQPKAASPNNDKSQMRATCGSSITR